MQDDPAAFRAWVHALGPARGVVRSIPGPLAEIRIDAPDSRNALTPQMMVQLADAVAALAQPEAGARVVLLSGEGGTFCSGGDLGAVRAHLGQPGSGGRLAGWMHAVTEALAALPCPVIAVLEGAALGGGAELLTAADLVLAHPGATIGWVQARLGVTPGFGGGTRLVRRIGAPRALTVLADARPLSAAAALQLGLIDAVCDDPRAAALEKARAWLELAPEVLAGTVRVVRAARDLDRADALRVEALAFHEVWGGAAHQRALDRARAGRSSPGPRPDKPC